MAEPPFSSTASGGVPRVTKSTRRDPQSSIPDTGPREGKGSARAPSRWAEPSLTTSAPLLPPLHSPRPLAVVGALEPWLPSLCSPRLKERSAGKPAHSFAEHPLEARKLERDNWDEV